VRLHPASIRVPALLKELDRLAPKYLAAVVDTGRWRLAKQQAQFPPASLPDPATLAKQVATDGAGLLRQLAALAHGPATRARASTTAATYARPTAHPSARTAHQAQGW
jgi:hypothetical protein